jgi:3-phytase
VALFVFLLAAVAISALAVSGRSGSDQSRESGGRSGEVSDSANEGRPFARLVPSRETAAVPHSGDAADDPAIWVNRAKPSESAIVGTDKDGGLAVYDLTGRQLQYRADGEINNVDLRTGFRLGDRAVVLVAAGNRSDNSIAIYLLNVRTRRLENVAARQIHPGIETYGSCLYRSPRSHKTYYFVTSKSGQVEQWELFDSGAGGVDARRVRSLEVGSQTEGCVADDRLARFYVSEESKGIWRYGAEPDSGSRRVLVDSTARRGHLVADVEGLAIAYGAGSSGFLIASSQGSNSFTIYRRAASNGYLSTFELGAGNGIDAVEDTDGIDVTTASLGSPFQDGLFVAQDGTNEGGNQNFKLVGWRVSPRARP